MKKFLVAVLILTCFIFAGCSSVGTVGLIQSSDGSVIEFYRIPYAETELLNAGITEVENENIKKTAKQKLDEYFLSLIQSYKEKIDANETYTDEQKQDLKKGVRFISNINNSQSENPEKLEYIQYEVYFDNSTCYLQFKDANELLKEPKEVVVEKTLFTTTTKVVKHPVFDNIVQESVTLGNHVVETIENVVIDVLSGVNATPTQRTIAENRWNYIKILLNYNTTANSFSYCYVVPSARFHSNANKVIAQNGYYYHFWDVDSNNTNLSENKKVHIEYWTTTANKPIWYAVAVLGGIITIAITYVVYKKNKRKEEKDFIDSI